MILNSEQIRNILIKNAEACVIAGSTNNQIVVNATLTHFQVQLESLIPNKPKLSVENFVRN